MRYKYETRGIVLARQPFGEASALVTILTSELGLVRARVQGVRSRGAKLAPALATLVESSVILLRGRDGWRLSGATLEGNWFERLERASVRQRAARVCGLLLRLAAEEAHDRGLFPIVTGFFTALSEYPDDVHEAAEILAALRILSVLGFDVGDVPADALSFDRPQLSVMATQRPVYIARINRDIAASGL